MITFYRFFYTLVRIYIFAKIFYLLYMTSSYPESYPISMLTWWMYFLIFDIWLEIMLPTKKDDFEKKINPKDDPLV
jgi:hypothetical protein